ncbi:FUSC family protein [Vibrio sp. La 4.2.2]|uniref:FUSC family protein n=1 Tax=Vibrio sp. La 4.2.2 TaxID=2998830 RepID=UPI0022CDE9F6|nr:FUSC family protein [Vibrio sp. La 4.2.2]MDA0107098.1 FUSC family protein [Vibrio sp. La 4.2.2]
MLATIARQWTNPESVAFALRFCLAVLMTWGLSLLMDSSATSTSMATAAIIQITGSRGASIKKAAARLIGTFTGGAYVLFVASATLIDSWLFNSFIIFGVVTSLGIASYFHGRVSYMFAVMGITLSLVGFPLAANPDMTNLFDHVQLRCVGISFGILMAMVAAMIIPYKDDQHELFSVKNYTENFLSNLFVTDEDNATKLTRAFLVFVSKKWQLVDDEIYGSRNAKEEKLNSRTAFYDSINIGIKAIELKKLGEAIAIPNEAWEELCKANFRVDINESWIERWGIKDIDLVEVFNEQVALFATQLDLYKSENSVFDYTNKDYANDIGRFTDGYVVLNNMVRATITLFTLSFMWIELQWDSGMSAMIMAGMIISVYAANPGSEQAQSPNIYAQFLAGGFAFILTFGAMPIGSPWIVAVVGFTGVYLAAYWFWQSKSLLKVVCMVSLFSWTSLVPLTSAPSYDFENFLNSIVGNITALLILWGAFYLIPARTTATVIKKELNRFINKFKVTDIEKRKSLNVSNWILASYAYLISISDLVSINRLLYLKALQSVINHEELEPEEREILLSSIDKKFFDLGSNQIFSNLMDYKATTAAKHNYRWFVLCDRYNALKAQGH